LLHAASSTVAATIPVIPQMHHNFFEFIPANPRVFSTGNAPIVKERSVGKEHPHSVAELSSFDQDKRTVPEGPFPSMCRHSLPAAVRGSAAKVDGDVGDTVPHRQTP